MPSTKASVLSKRLPPAAASYHWILEPTATKSATVGVGDEQKDWVASPVGAPGSQQTTKIEQPSWTGQYVSGVTKEAVVLEAPFKELEILTLVGDPELVIKKSTSPSVLWAIALATPSNVHSSITTEACLEEPSLP